MDRRQFILAAAAFAAGCSRGSDPVTAVTAASPPLGLQLYTVRDLMADDVAATLALVAGIGYREVEFAGYFDTPPETIRRMIADAGLSAPSAHVQYSSFLESVDRVLEHAMAVGHRFVIVPAIPEDERASLDDYGRHADNFNRWGEACAQAGLRFGYHNHAFEFEKIDGQVPYDLLLAETEAAQVAMELDLAWAHGGKADALRYFDAWPGRFPAFHIKDLDRAGEEVDIGDGEVAFEEILAQAGKAGLQHGFVERDHPADARRSIRHNYEAIRPLWDQYL